MAIAYNSSLVTTNLALCLDAANPRSWPGSGTTWRDVSGNARNGTLVNGPTFNSSNGGSFVFDGIDDYVNVSNSNLNHGTSDFAYSCWVNLAGKPAAGTIFENGSWVNCILIRYENTGITIFSMGSYYGFFTFNPSLSTWHHLTFVRSGNSILFYINGVFSESIAFGTSLNVNPSPNNLFIGTSQHAVSQCFNGRINLATVYTSALTAAQVAQNFNATRGRYGV
jgi:hypothetical protein